MHSVPQHAEDAALELGSAPVCPACADAMTLRVSSGITDHREPFNLVRSPAATPPPTRGGRCRACRRMSLHASPSQKVYHRPLVPGAPPRCAWYLLRPTTSVGPAARSPSSRRTRPPRVRRRDISVRAGSRRTKTRGEAQMRWNALSSNSVSDHGRLAFPTA
jgi:hypothetical protein